MCIRDRSHPLCRANPSAHPQILCFTMLHWAGLLHTHPFNGPCPGLPGWASTRKVKPMWILQKQEAVSCSGISWDICTSAPRSRQITMPAPHHSVFYRPDALPVAQPTASKHWRQAGLPLHPFNGLFSRITWVSRYQKGKTSLDLHEARDDGVLGCSGISWTICKQSDR